MWPPTSKGLISLRADSVLRPQSFRVLRYGPSRLLLVLYAPPGEGSGRATTASRVRDLVHNAGAFARAVDDAQDAIGSFGLSGSLHDPVFRHSVEEGIRSAPSCTTKARTAS